MLEMSAVKEFVKYSMPLLIKSNILQIVNDMLEEDKKFFLSLFQAGAGIIDEKKVI